MPTTNSGTKLNHLTSFLKSHHKAIILALCLILLNIFFLCWGFKTNSLTFGKTFVFMLIGSIVLEIGLCILIYYAKKRHWKIERIFLVLSIILGSIYTLALPVGRAPDEASHFFRIYEITEGHFTSDSHNDKTLAGSLEPQSITIVDQFANQNVTYREIINNLGIQAEGEEVFVATSAYGYSPISYLPQVIGMSVGKILHLPFLIGAYLAKFANLFFCIIILYFCIKYTPFLKKIIFLLAFLPISMQAMCSLSADAPIFVTSVALVCFVLYSIYSYKDQFTKKHYLLILFLCIIISIGKITYAPLCLLLFAIPSERFSKIKAHRIRNKLLWIISAGAIVVATYLIWYMISPPTITVSDASSQISYIIHNPINYLAIVIRSISTNTMLYLSGTFGGFLEWFNVVPSMLYIMALYTIFIILCIKARETHFITKSLKVLSIIIFPIITLAIFTAMFITWTKSGETIIDGVQGRYLLPILLLIPLAFLPVKSNTKLVKNASFHNYYLYIFVIFECVYIISNIACTHI